jgi:AcrR family transcriptional regulator
MVSHGGDTDSSGSTVKQVPPAGRVRRSQQERSATARTKLMAAAIELICERGFGNTTIADVAASAGMTRGAIQHHFAGRDELVLSILHELERQIVTAFDTTRPKAFHSATERASRLIDALGTVAQSEAYLAVVDIWMSTRSEIELREGVRASMARSFQSYHDLWQRGLAGLVPPEIISDCRRMVVNIMRGVVISRIFIADTTSVKLTITTCKKMIVRYLEAELGEQASRRTSQSTSGHHASE